MHIFKISLLLFYALNIKAMQSNNVPQGIELIKAAERGDCAAISKYKADGGDMNATSFGDSALMRAVLQGHDPAAKLLLELGASPDIQDQFGETVLFYDRCSASVFKTALKANANVNIQDHSGRTVLSTLLKFDSVSRSARSYKVALLVKFKAKTHIPDNEGKTSADYGADNWVGEYLGINASDLEKIIQEYERVYLKR